MNDDVKLRTDRGPMFETRHLHGPVVGHLETMGTRIHGSDVMLTLQLSEACHPPVGRACPEVGAKPYVQGLDVMMSIDQAIGMRAALDELIERALK